MYTNLKVNFNDIDIFIFDFDGVLTPNTVFIDQNGKESVQCSRSDGLAFDVLNKLNKVSYIVSTEKNSVVAARAKKLNILSMQKVENKLEAIKTIVNKHESDLKRVLFVGNDVNDLTSLQFVGYPVIVSNSDISLFKYNFRILKSKGGNGALKELLNLLK